ncbi:MAG: M48 family metalloprotease [Acidobacteria bacterium]|nr:M48 family metalloprotease [Acidobacteriota bacterium]
MISPAQQHWQGAFYDGVTPRRHDAEILLWGDHLEIRTAAAEDALAWLYAATELAQGQYAGEPIRLEHGRESVVVEDRRFLEAWRQVSAGERPREGFAAVSFRQGLLAILAVAAIVGGVWLWGAQAVSGLAAAVLPTAWEDRLGRSVMQELAPPERRCEEPRRREALDALTARLSAALPESPYHWEIAMVHGPVNALAAPGGHIVVFDELVAMVESPEELAAVLAHEMQHVELRHSTRSLFRQMTLEALLAALGAQGSWTASGGTLLTSLAFARRDESAADAQGLRMLEAAGIDGHAMARVFERFAAMEGDTASLVYLSTHPDSAERARLLQEMAAPAPDSPTPALTPAQWRALRRPCEP